MARSDVITWLPLDRWFQIMGVSPLSGNQLASNTLFRNTTCGEVWFADAWQHSDRVGRNDLAMAIQAAEQEISREVGFNLLPDWTLDERLAYPKSQQPGATPYYGTLNPSWFNKSVEANRGHLISGGLRTKSLIQAGLAIVRTDLDVDQYAETCTVTVATTVTDTNQIRLYYPAKNGADGWEIRPITVSLSGGVATITFKAWQIAAANQQDALDAQPLDADVAGSYETTVDCYRVYNDPGTQVQFLWEGSGCGSCTACQFSSQYGCFHLRDPRMGFLVPTPGTWDAATQEFTSVEWGVCREPDQVRLYYYSGNRDLSLARPYVEMSTYWEYAVAYYAASKLDRPVCGCSNVAEFIEKWRKDMMFSSQENGGFNVTPEFAANHLGTSVGAFYAYRRTQQPGVKINK